jgi:hypothetical protein
MEESLRWWQGEVIYQVLVPSFLDTNGDGVGDLRGVIERLEYVQWLGARSAYLRVAHEGAGLRCDELLSGGSQVRNLGGLF